MAFCFLSSRLPSLRRIIYENRLLEKEGVGEEQSINSFNEKDRMRMGRGDNLHSAGVLVEQGLDPGFPRSSKGKVIQGALPLRETGRREGPGRSPKGGLL